MLPGKLEILYEDEYIIAINKPPKMLVIQDRFNKLEENLHDILAKLYKEIYTLHRLDKETSGVIIFAKDSLTHKELSIQFEKHKVQKTYHLLVKGLPKENVGVINLPIGKKNAHENIMVIDKKNGKPSITNYKVLKKFKQYTFIEAMPLTGRTHQIRVHFKAIGLPLAIDKLYSNNEKIFLSDIKPKFTPSVKGEKPLMERLTLHAYSIEFIHPNTKQKMRIVAEHFKDFRSLLRNLEKYGN